MKTKTQQKRQASKKGEKRAKRLKRVQLEKYESKIAALNHKKEVEKKQREEINKILASRKDFIS